MSGDPQPAPAPHAWRRVVMPHEHGGWSFLAEPLALGNLVAPSPAGTLIALAALAAFLARQPLVLAISDRRRGHRYARTVTAERAFALLALIAAASLAGAVALGRGRLLVAVGLAAPLAALALAFDLSRRSRALAAELSGAMAIGSTVAAIALSGTWRLAPALGLWGVLAARSVSSIAYVRARLRLERGEPDHRAVVLATQIAAVLAVTALAVAHLAPWLSVAAFGVLGLRAALGLSPWRIPLQTWQLGLTEIGFGALTVAAVIVGIRIEG